MNNENIIINSEEVKKDVGKTSVQKASPFKNLLNSLLKYIIKFRKAEILIASFIILCGASAAFTYYFFVRDVVRDITEEKEQQVQIISDEKEKLDSANKALEAQLAELSADYDRVSRDRKNVIEQSKRIIQERNELLNFKKSFEEVSEEKEKYQKEREETVQKLNSLLKETNQIRSEYEQELAAVKEQIRTYQEEIAEKDKTNKELINKTGIKKLEETIEKLKKTNNDLAGKLKEIDKEKEILNRQLEQNKEEYGKENSTLQKLYNELNNKYIELTAEHQKLEEEEKRLNRKLSQFPSKIVNLANENKKLVKETASMHYNLGVFYFGKQEYKRAIPEFERAIKINAQDADSYYHLGYIYSEYLMDQDKAIKYFNRYLELSPRGVHAAWVRQYILSWHIWEEKERVD